MCFALSEPAGREAVVLGGFMHPFFHEIVRVEPAEDPDARAELVSEFWPGFMVGSLMLVRAGVVVRDGANSMDPVAASQSRMFRALVAAQPDPDRPIPWQCSNSQWGTDFRRDYLADGELHHDVDGYKHR